MTKENGKGGDRPNFPSRNTDKYKNKPKRGADYSRTGDGMPYHRRQEGMQRDRGKFDKTKGVWAARPKWTPVAMLEDALPVPQCPICGKPITELSSAFSDKMSGEAVHFECARESAGRSAALSPGDTVAYIGAGRFAVVNYPHTQNFKNASIKQIIEWEKREERMPWRRLVADHFSLT
ncbi:MAG: hypothetical protein LBG72_08465 [Spirochaetaceae bacterium]|jgi:hypothetical protein|nr:hypothetical protein [Spirochaetaceae bacterium]